jgi:hypothetical protein
MYSNKQDALIPHQTVIKHGNKTINNNKYAQKYCIYQTLI